MPYAGKGKLHFEQIGCASIGHLKHKKRISQHSEGRFTAMDNDMSCLTKNDAPIDREQIRARLRKMTKSQLKRYGKDLVFLCSPERNNGQIPREAFVIQLEEAREEWWRRKQERA